jgi:hypothetical protein
MPSSFAKPLTRPLDGETLPVALSHQAVDIHLQLKRRKIRRLLDYAIAKGEGVFT